MKWFVLFPLLISINIQAQYLKQGKWGGMIQYSQQAIPFTFEVSYPNGTTPQFTFINGQEKREINHVSWQDDSLVIALRPFDVEIKAAVTAMTMEGYYTKFYRNTSFGFTATYGAQRFKKKSIQQSATVEERWDMVFEEGTPSESKGIGLFRKIGETVYGTIMAKTSDHRYFEGIVDGDSMKLSSFDGAHAFMISGKKEGNNWSGELILDDNYSEKWTAVPDPDANIIDPFEIVKLEEGKHQPYYDLLGAGSGRNAIDPSDYEGKVLVIQLFGTWCPNSHDQTQYLVEWVKNKMPDGVAILASSYEANYSQEYGFRRIREYIEDNQIPYEVVLGGRLSKSSAAMPFPFMNKIEAFPTLVIIDKQGYARYVHSYFNGPATGQYYDEFDQRFNKIIDELISE